MKQKAGYCPVCDRQVYAVGRNPNHVLHLLLCIFTLGIWWIVWALLAAGTVGNYRCTRCGSRVQSVEGPHHRAGRKHSDNDDDEDEEEEDDQPPRRRRR